MEQKIVSFDLNDCKNFHSVENETKKNVKQKKGKMNAKMLRGLNTFNCFFLNIRKLVQVTINKKV